MGRNITVIQSLSRSLHLQTSLLPSNMRLETSFLQRKVLEELNEKEIAWRMAVISKELVLRLSLSLVVMTWWNRIPAVRGILIGRLRQQQQLVFQFLLARQFLLISQFRI